jgi:hypothetical protein
LEGVGTTAVMVALPQYYFPILLRRTQNPEMRIGIRILKIEQGFDLVFFMTFLADKCEQMV